MLSLLPGAVRSLAVKVQILPLTPHPTPTPQQLELTDNEACFLRSPTFIGSSVSGAGAWRLGLRVSESNLRRGSDSFAFFVIT